MKRYHIWTIGCQMNEADSGRVAAELDALGYAPTARPEDADVIVLNTCVVRQSAEDKALGRLWSLKPLKESDPGRVIALMGCLIGVKPNPALRTRFPLVDVFMPPSDPAPLVGYLAGQAIERESRAFEDDLTAARHLFQDYGSPEAAALGLMEDFVPISDFGFRISDFGLHQSDTSTRPQSPIPNPQSPIPNPQSPIPNPQSPIPNPQSPILQSIRHLSLSGETPVTANVPVVYGCSHACTYCIIPSRRGVERSRPLDEIVREVQGLVDQGVREVTLLGQIVDRYGKDLSTGSRQAFPGQRPDLADLLRAVHEVEGLWRIRFLTSHPSYMTDRILQAVSDLPKVCEQIEAPVQAGDDAVLAAMKRGYTSDDYRRLVGHIRQTIPGTAIHTDIIVGFPGETAEQFQRTYDLLAELRVDKAHLAMYSPRPGTVSARRMADDVPLEEKKRRWHALDALQSEVVGEINRRLLGDALEVLVEGKHKDRWRGRTRTNKLVFFADAENWRGRLAQVRITWAGPWSMIGEVVRG